MSMIIKTENDFPSTMEWIISNGNVISLPVNFSLSIFQILNTLVLLLIISITVLAA